MVTPENVDQEFRAIFFDHLKKMEDTTLDRMIRVEARPKIMDMIHNKQVSRMTVVACFIEGVKLYPHRLYHICEGLLYQIGEPSKLGGYPELLGLVHSTGFLMDRDTVDKVSDIARLLVTIVGHQLARSYLNYLFLTSTGDEARIVIPAYYYTHHDMESLRLVIPFASADDLRLSHIIYGNALSFVASSGTKHLSQEDIRFLTAFFEKGLTYTKQKQPGVESVYEFSQQAIERLKAN